MALVKERSKDVIIDGININFESLFLSTPVLQALQENNFKKPSPIQLKAIPLGKCGLDLIVKSKSGTGKTAVFAIISLEMIDITMDQLQVLILAPTREIAVQSCDVIITIGKHIKGLKVEHFIGGLPVKEDALKVKGCHIAVASPGRMLHLITSGTIDVQHIKLFILDEADSLMDISFQSDINKIFHRLPNSKQMLALSATFPNELDVFLSQYMHIPTHVSPQVDTPLLLGLKHFVTITPFNVNAMFLTKHKSAELIRLLSHISFTQCLVFCNYQTRAEEVTNFLNTKDWKADYISGAQTQKQRLEVLNRLKEFQCRILLSTDLTARGIDAVNVDLVINYDVPNDESTYLHRMGRAGRYGAKGLCVTIAAKGAEVTKFTDIIGAIGGREMSVPLLPKDKLPDNIWAADVKGLERVEGTLKQRAGESHKLHENIQRSVNEILRAPALELKEKTSKKSSTSNFIEPLYKKQNVDTESDILEVKDEHTRALLAAGKSRLTQEASITGKASVFNKNVSLLTVTSLLDDDNFDVDNDQTETIGSFIATLKETDNEELDDESYIETDNEKYCEFPKSDIEEVFIHAYNYAICKRNPDWAEIYDFKDEERAPKEKSVNLLQDLLEYVANEENPEFGYDENDDEEYEDFYNEEYEDVQPSMEWIPVDESEKKIETHHDGASAMSTSPDSQNVNNCNNVANQVTIVNDSMYNFHINGQYDGLFDHSVRYFEEGFNTLENASDFELFWSSWQKQISSVRDYVQQNIYLNEMNAYLGGRNDHN